MPENRNEDGDRITLGYGALRPARAAKSSPEPIDQTNGHARINAIKKDPLGALLSRGEIFIPCGHSGDLVALARLAIKNKYIMQCEGGEEMDKIEEMTRQLHASNLTVEIIDSGSAIIVINPHLLEDLNGIFLEAGKGATAHQNEADIIDSKW